MKTIISLIISVALVVSGYAQTRNVLVGTNNAVVQPTNFWSADASNARSGLGLGSAATNPSSAFQPSSTILSNISLGNAVGLTNFPTLNQNTTGTASNVTGVVSIANGGTGSTNAESARTALGLSAAATSAITQFQPSSTVLSNLANSNGVSLTNIASSSINGTVALASNVTGVVSVVNGGTGATNASGARTALELGTASTNPATAFQPSSLALTSLATNNGGSLTNITANSIVGTVGLASNITGTAPLATNVTGVVALANGGTAGTNAASARTSLGATTVGVNLFTLVNPDDTRFIRLNANNTVSALSAADMRTALSVGTNLGTVTSVGMTVPNIFSISTSTITSSGTFAITLANQSSRQAFIVPNGGGTPAFRALESDDLPSLAISKITGLQTALDGKLSTSGTATLATNVTGVVAVANGGTGGTTAESGRTGLGATTVGSAVFTLVNPSAIRFLRYNADNTVSALSDSDFRTAIGLGTASTNPSSAFQPASSSLTNLAANNAVGLTNLQATNLVGIIPTSNIATVNFSNVAGILSVASGGTGATNAAGARISFGLDSAATNPATAFQPSSSVLTNLAANNGSSLTNIPVAGVVGAMATNGNGFGLTNLNASNITGLIPASNIPSIAVSNLSGTLSIASGGTGATNVAQARTNLGLGWSALTNTSNLTFRDAINIGESNVVYFSEVGVGRSLDNYTMSGTAPQTSQNFGFSFKHSGSPFLTISNLLGTNGGALIFHGTVGAAITRTNLGLGATWLTNTNVTNFRTAIGLGATNNVAFAEISANFIDVDYLNASSTTNVSQIKELLITGTNGIQFNEAQAISATRTNLGLGATWLTNTNVTNFRTAIGLGATNNVAFNSLQLGGGTNVALFIYDEQTILGDGVLYFQAGEINFKTPIEFNNTTNAAITRTNLGLGWSALTNTNDGTGLVSVNTNGVVVSPTNFWQVAPIQTVVQNLIPITSSTNAATNARNLYVYSLATNITGVTNTVTLPTNTSTFGGDNATIIHQGPTSSVTVIRQAGTTNNLISINRFDESVKFIYENNAWATYHNISFQEPIYFSGTNTSANAAASRTNLGIPLAALTNTNNSTFQQAIFTTNSIPTNTTTPNTVNFTTAIAWMEVSIVTNNVTNSYRVPLFR